MRSRVVLMALALLVVLGIAWVSAAGQPQQTGTQPVQLLHYVFTSGDLSDRATVYSLINEKLTNQIGATVEYIDIPGAEYDQRMQVVINSGERYDVNFTSNWRNNYHVNVGRGAFADLTDLLPRLAPTIWNTQAEFIDAARVRGRIYAVLNEQIFARSRMTVLPYEYTDRAGINPDEYSRRALSGTEDLYDLDLEMRQRFDAVTGPNAVYARLGERIAFDKHFIVPVIDERVPGAVYGDDDSLRVVNQYETPEFLELLEYTNKLKGLNLLRNADLVADAEEARRYRAAGEIILPIAPDGTFKPGGQEEEEVRWEYLYYQVPMTPATVTTGAIIATMLAVNSQSRNIDKAVEYLEAVFSDDSIYMLFHFGQEGKHYALENGFVRAIGGTGYTRGATWSMGSQFQQIPSVGQPADVWDQTRRLNAAARQSPELGFSFDPTNVVAEIGQCRSVYDEYMVGLMNGTRPIADYQEMLAKYEAAGSAKIMAEIQRQLDAWKASR